MLQPRDNGTIMKMISSDDEGTTTELFRDEDKIKQYVDVDEHIKQQSGESTDPQIKDTNISSSEAKEFQSFLHDGDAGELADSNQFQDFPSSSGTGEETDQVRDRQPHAFSNGGPSADKAENGPEDTYVFTDPRRDKGSSGEEEDEEDEGQLDSDVEELYNDAMD